MPDLLSSSPTTTNAYRRLKRRRLQTKQTKNNNRRLMDKLFPVIIERNYYNTVALMVGWWWWCVDNWANGYQSVSQWGIIVNQLSIYLCRLYLLLSRISFFGFVVTILLILSRQTIDRSSLLSLDSINSYCCIFKYSMTGGL